MSTRAMGPGQGWHWLMRATNLGRRNPKAVIGAIALVALVALVPSVLQMLAQPLLGAQPNLLLGFVAVTTLLSLVVFPLLIGGALRVIDAAEHDRETRAAAVFDVFRGAPGAGRLVGFGLLMAALYLLVFGTIIGVFGKDLPDWYMQMMQVSMDAAGKPVQPGDLPEPPAGLGMVMALGLLFGLFLGGAYAIGFGQVALGGRSVSEAIRDGLAGALKNLLPIVVMAVLVIVALFALMLVVALLGGVLMLVGGLVHPALAVLLVLPVYLGMIMLMYVVMFGVMYHMWRDICADTALPPPLPDNRVEL